MFLFPLWVNDVLCLSLMAFFLDFIFFSILHFNCCHSLLSLERLLGICLYPISIHGTLLSGRSKSTQVGYGPCQYSNRYVLFFACDATSAAIDFSKGNIDDGVVDSPPYQGPCRLPMVSPSPLQGSLCKPCLDYFASPTPRPLNTPH